MASSLNHVILLVALLLAAADSFAFELKEISCNPKTLISPFNPIHASISGIVENIVISFEQGATFLESSFGQGDNLTYSLAQCRGDVDQKNCLDCIKDASSLIYFSCSNYTDAYIWYDYCFIRYSQENFYGVVDTSEGTVFMNSENVTSTPPDVLGKVLAELFDGIEFDAKFSGGLGTGLTLLSQFDTLYGLAQCTKDLTSIPCGQCLDAALQHFNQECSGSKGCEVIYTSCTVRYELYPFFFPLPEGSEATIPDVSSLKKLIIHR